MLCPQDQVARSAVLACEDAYFGGSSLLPYEFSTDRAGAIFGTVGDKTILAFVGSNDPSDWSTLSGNLNSRFFQTSSMGGVHEGFWLSLSEVLEGVWDRLDAHGVGDSLVIAGHSRGGAHAILMAAVLASRGIKASQVITFGSPPVGNKLFAKKYAALGIPTTRYVYQSDPVPAPPWFGYEEVGRLRWHNGRSWQYGRGMVGCLKTYLFSRNKLFLDLFQDHSIGSYVKSFGA